MLKLPILSLAVLLLAGMPASAQEENTDAALAQLAPEGEWRASSSLEGQPGYADGFPHFSYVNPDAPKGGTVRLSATTTTFDTLNPILSKGVPGAGLGHVFETLFTSALDEYDISAAYPQLAEAVRYQDDYSSVTYRINAAARWHDGTPVSAEDVVWSFEKLTELNPNYTNYYRHVTGAAKTGEREVTFTFDETGNRELPHIVGQLIVLPKHWWEGTDANGRQRNVAESTLEPPLGSGPYRVSQVIPGRSIAYERVPDFWGADLNTNIGQNNFDTIRYEYFRDRTVEFEAFKADKFDYWQENEAKRWETGYDFPALTQGRVKKERVTLEQASGAMVGFVPNLRRPLFQDVRVRRAFNLAFDFEDLNRSLFYGQYERIDSFFYGIPLRWEGLPAGQELEILETVRDKLPPEVFTTEYRNPEGGTPQKVRANLQEAIRLMQEAGYSLQGGRMVGPDGRQVTVELLLNGPIIERVAIPYQKSLERIGIRMTIRTADPSQFVQRVHERDFDLVYLSWSQSTSPGNEQMAYWGSKSADQPASPNYGGISDEAVDELIRRVVFAKDRAELVAATKALDRVLMINQYTIPSYIILDERIAYWDRFGHPQPFPRFAIGFPSVWWWDEEKAAATGAPR